MIRHRKQRNPCCLACRMAACHLVPPSIVFRRRPFAHAPLMTQPTCGCRELGCGSRRNSEISQLLPILVTFRIISV
ncbi:hypothetical protein Hsc_3682 [Herbaspirillum seropedicae]|nr:hypothetical protein Hsc_3682 [Herbaspirillum seropedicae]